MLTVVTEAKALIGRPAHASLDHHTPATAFRDEGKLRDYYRQERRYD
jgi:hypothetical protein